MEVEIECYICGNKQTYKPRGNKIAKRPKTPCKKCGKWIYIDKDQLTKNDQKTPDPGPLIDQRTDQLNDYFDEYDQRTDQKEIWPTDPNDQIDQKNPDPGSLIDQKTDQKTDQLTKNHNFEINDIVAKLIDLGNKSIIKGYNQVAKVLDGDDKNSRFQARRILDTLYMVKEILEI